MASGKSRVIAAAVWVAVGFGLAGWGPGADTMLEQERLQFADGLYSREMWALAIKEYQAYLKDFPQGGRMDQAHFRLGESFRRVKNTEGAEKEFAAVFREYPASEFRFKAGLKLADLQGDGGRTEAAVETLRVVLKEKPPADVAAAARYSLGDSLAKLNQTAEAMKILEQVRQEDKNSEFRAFAMLRLAGLQAAGQPPGAGDAAMNKAIEIYQEVIAGAPADRLVAEALFHMGDLHFRLKAHEKSAEVYRALLGKFPNDPRAAEARLQAAWASHHAGLYVEALKIADETLAAPTPAPEARADWLYLKANAERQLLKHEAAVKTYVELLAIPPRKDLEHLARFELAVTYYRMGRFQDAADSAGKVNLPDDGMKDVYWLMAESFTALKKVDDAIQYYRMIVKKFPRSDVGADAVYRLARHLQTKESIKDAAQFYGLLATDYPENKLAAPSLFASAFCLSRLGQDAEAVRDWGTLIAKYAADPLVEPAFYQKAMHEIRLKRDADAMASLDNLVRQFAKSTLLADAQYWRGLMLKDQGKLDDSEKALREVLKPDTRQDLRQEAQFHLAGILRKKGALDESAPIYLDLLGSPIRDKLTPDLLQWLSEYWFAAKKPDAAAQAARALVEKTRDAAWLQIGWCLAGRAYGAKGDAKAARDAYTRATQADAKTPSLAEAALRLGELALADGDHKLASSHFSKAAEAAGGDALLGIRGRAYVGLGRAAKAARDYAEAARYFMSVAVLFDDPEIVPECLSEAAAAFRGAGQADAARQAADELLKRYPQSDLARQASTNAAPATGP